MVELLAVVAMVGILAAVAMVSYRSYLNASRTSDAKAIIGAIRIAEENYRAETLSYLNVSGTLTNFYPAAPDGKKRHFHDPSKTALYAAWKTLDVTTDSPTTFGFAVVSGGPGDTIGAVPGITQQPSWPTPSEPWYVVLAAGDQDGDSTYSYLVASSFTGEIYVENEAE